MLTYTTIKNIPGYEDYQRAVCNMPIERLQKNITKFNDFLGSNKKFLFNNDKSSRMNRDCAKEFLNMLNEAIENRFPQCVKEKEASFVSKKLPENLLKEPNKNTIFNSLNETKTTNSKGDNSMNKKIDELLTLVKNLTDRVAELETKQTAPRFKKLREHKEEPKTEKIVKVEKKVEAPKAPKAPKVKTANAEQKAEIVKLQKKAQEGKKSLTAKQMAQYKRLWHAKWQEVNKTIDINDKAARSLAFAKGRIACLKKARTY